MIGAIFVDAICTAPWGFSVPPMERVAHLLAPGTERLVGYHLVTHGKAVIGLEGSPDITITAGDIVIGGQVVARRLNPNAGRRRR
jgi:hypothetical protein